MRAITFGDIDAVYLARELEEDEERRERGQELVSFEVPEEFFWELCDYMEKKHKGAVLFQEMIREYMEAHPV